MVIDNRFKPVTLNIVGGDQLFNATPRLFERNEGDSPTLTAQEEHSGDNERDEGQSHAADEYNGDHVKSDRVVGVYHYINRHQIALGAVGRVNQEHLVLQQRVAVELGE